MVGKWGFHVGDVSPGVVAWGPPPNEHRQTDMTENFTLPQATNAGGNETC